MDFKRSYSGILKEELPSSLAPNVLYVSCFDVVNQMLKAQWSVV